MRAGRRFGCSIRASIEACLIAYRVSPVSFSARPGSSSATWYLMLKNLIATQPSLPRTVIILFRSRQLTLPSHRTQGEYRRSMEQYMRRIFVEPLVEKLAGPDCGFPPRRLDRLVQAVAYPMERRRQSWRRRKCKRGHSISSPAAANTPRIHNDAKALFGPEKSAERRVQEDEPTDGGSTSLDPNDHVFDAMVDGSFLPHLLQIAGDKGIHLVFFEVKRRPYADGRPGEESPTAQEYTRALGAYLDQRGARLYDETHDRDVTLDFYGSGDHVRDEMIPRYTEIFWGKIAKLVHQEAAR